MAYDEEFDPETDYMSDEEQQDSPVPQPMPAPVQVPVVPQQAPSQPVAAPERTAYLENYDPATGIRNRTAVPYVPRQAPAAPLVDINWRALQNVQADQAAKAVAIAMQYQGMRGYQSELAKGTPAAQALAKWAPAMFYGSPAAGSAVARAIQPEPQLSYQTLPDGTRVATFGKTLMRVPQNENWQFQKGEGGMPDLWREQTTGKIKPASSVRSGITPAQAAAMLADPVKTAFLQSQFGKDTPAFLENLKRVAMSGMGQANASPTEAPQKPSAPATGPIFEEVPAKEKRKIGAVYKTPKGNFTWTANGWSK